MRARSKRTRHAHTRGERAISARSQYHQDRDSFEAARIVTQGGEKDKKETYY